MSNNITNAERATVLVQALPNIKRYVGKIVVVKYGGNAMVNEELKQQVMEDIVLLTTIGIKIVLVHGGGPAINRMMEILGKKPKFIDGLRVTDSETVEIAQMVLAGKVNKDLVKLLQRHGGNVIGLSGIDGRLIETKVKDKKLGFVGTITGVNTGSLLDILDKGYTPVISTIAADSEGNTYNVNADTAASHIAGALGAERLILMTDICGVLKDKDDPSTLIKEMTVSDAVELYKENIISGGMIPKVDCCIDAINRGVKRAVIMDGRVSHSILMELLTDEGAGTMIKGDEADV